MSRKHNTRHNRGRSNYPARLQARGLSRSPMNNHGKQIGAVLMGGCNCKTCVDGSRQAREMKHAGRIDKLVVPSAT